MEEKITFERINNLNGFLKYITDEKDKIDFLDLMDKGAPYYKCFEPNIYVAKLDNVPVGIINLDIPKCDGYNTFFDILIFRKFREKRFSLKIWRAFETKIIPNVLSSLKRKCISATVDKTNTPSIKFLTSVGFRPLPDNFRRALIQRKVLKPNELRFVKCYY